MILQNYSQFSFMMIRSILIILLPGFLNLLVSTGSASQYSDDRLTLPLVSVIFVISNTMKTKQVLDSHFFLYPKDPPKTESGINNNAGGSSFFNANLQSSETLSDSLSRKSFLGDDDEEFNVLLQQFGNILSEYNQYNFLIVTDIDGILYQSKHPVGDSDAALSAHSKKSDKKIKLNQKRRLEKIKLFFQKYPNVFLVYNMTSSFIPVAESRWQTFLGHDSYRFGSRLPVPDAIISNAGAKITKKSKLLGDRISFINEQLKEWLLEDNDEPLNKVSLWQGDGMIEKPFILFNNLQKGDDDQTKPSNPVTFTQFTNYLNHQFIYRFGNNPDRYKAITNKQEYTGKTGDNPYDINSLPYIILTPFEEGQYLKQILFSNTRINKGQALRVLINLMHLEGDFGGRPTFLVVVGGGITDMPMIRIDQKANALTPLSVEQQSRTDSCMNILIDSLGELGSSVIWLKSIVFNNLNLKKLTNSHVSEMLKHEKVVQVDSDPGPSGFLKAIVNELKPDELKIWNNFFQK